MKRLVAYLLVLVMGFPISMWSQSQAANPTEVQERKLLEGQPAAKAKGEVQKRGTGERSRVKVTLRNQSEVRGYISQIEADTFQVTDSKIGKVMTNAYIAQGAKVKAEVTKRGVGKQSRVRVSLRDGTEVKGYISEVDDSSFSLTDQKSGKVTTISYEDVSKLKRQGLSKPAKVLITCGVLFGALLGLALVFGQAG
jgi:small nuclear ribonucleoprotein (snRNP)-like protein